MLTQTLTFVYKAHLTRIGDPTKTLVYDHAYRDRNGKIHSPETVARRCAKRGWKVERVEICTFNAQA